MPGSPLTEDIDVAFEQSIVWVQGGPDDYPYLRESSVRVGTRARRVTRCSEALVAYATLRPDAPNVTAGRFPRRIWTFQFGDRNPGDVVRCPMQAVRPRSIRAGHRSESGGEQKSVT